MIYIKTILLIHLMVTIIGYKEEFNLKKKNNFTSVKKDKILWTFVGMNSTAISVCD